MSKRRVTYYYDSDVGNYTFAPYHPMRPHRMRITHDLVSAYGMLDKMHVTKPKRASPSEMTTYHTDEYVKFITTVMPLDTQTEAMKHNTWRFFGSNDDNPPFEGVFEFCSISAGGSISAAKRINDGAADIAINWAGGLHHAKKREASGFCYINDIVLCILELLRTYTRVLYIDIDCHHGDGVEEAFYTTDRVFTCSFHKFGDYFPGTGLLDDTGIGPGRGYSANIPLKDGLADESFKSLFEPIVSRILEKFRPTAIVLQCGADSLAGDKLGCFNVTMRGHAWAVQFCRALNIPLVLLGGGGYTVKNVALTWTFETACALGIENEISDHLPWCEYFEWFGPRYKLDVLENSMEDANVKEGTLDSVRAVVMQQLQELPHAPSVALQDVPRDGFDEYLGFTYEEDAFKRKRPDDDDGDSERDDLDDEIAQYTKYLYHRDGDSPRSSPSPPRWRTTKWDRDVHNVSPEFSSDSDIESLYADGRWDGHTSRSSRARKTQLPGRFFYKERTSATNDNNSLGLDLMDPSTSQLRGEDGSDADEEDDGDSESAARLGRTGGVVGRRAPGPSSHGLTAKRRFFQAPSALMGVGLDARVGKVLAAHAHQGVNGAAHADGMFGTMFGAAAAAAYSNGFVRRGHDLFTDDGEMHVEVDDDER